MDLVNEIQELSKKLSNSIRVLAKYGNELAEKEKEYKIVLRQEALKLRTDGMPVTLINQIVYGIPEVAEKRFKRDVAETMYNTAQEQINVQKIQIKIMETQLKMEWGQKE